MIALMRAAVLGLTVVVTVAGAQAPNYAASIPEPTNRLLFLPRTPRSNNAEDSNTQADKFATSAEDRAAMRDKGLPVITRRVPPMYPRDMAKKRKAGCVVIAFVVSKDGVADQFKILNSVPSGEFDKAALAALFHWQFEPPNVPVPVIQSFSFGFEADTRSMNRIKPPSPKECDLPVVRLAEGRAHAKGSTVEHSITPYYPPEAVQSHIEGCIATAFDITTEGLADNYQIVQSSPPGIFDKATLWALNQWHFTPQKSLTRAAVVYRFDLRGAKNADENSQPAQCALPPEFETNSNTGITTP